MYKLFSILTIAVFALSCSSKSNHFEKDRYLIEAKEFLASNELKKSYFVDSKPFDFKSYACLDSLKNGSKVLTKLEIEEIDDQIKNSRIKNWSTDLLKKAKIVNHDTITNIFADKNKNWKYFKQKFSGSYKRYSAPIFFRNYTYCLFYYSNVCGRLCGNGAMVLYKKENGEWKSVETYCSWIS